jgi:hypothetical protein
MIKAHKEKGFDGMSADSAHSLLLSLIVFLHPFFRVPFYFGGGGV